MYEFDKLQSVAYPGWLTTSELWVSSEKYIQRKEREERETLTGKQWGVGQKFEVTERRCIWISFVSDAVTRAGSLRFGGSWTLGCACGCRACCPKLQLGCGCPIQSDKRVGQTVLRSNSSFVFLQENFVPSFYSKSK